MIPARQIARRYKSADPPSTRLSLELSYLGNVHGLARSRGGDNGIRSALDARCHRSND
jgi:hypothetical protein